MTVKDPKYIYTSPDGGHTVYQQEFGSEVRELVFEDDYAIEVHQYQNEIPMCGMEAIALRKRHPALQEAWDRYKTLWQLCVENDE